MSDTPITPDAIRAIVKKADRKNAKAEDVQALRELLSQLPALADSMVPLTDGVYDVVIESMYPSTPATKAMMHQTAKNRCNDLGYAEASPMEKMLIDAVVLAWLRYTQVERSAASVWGDSHTLERGAYWDKRLSAAQRRYLRAIETLARVRRLALPMLQVNIAEKQQVNVGG